MSEPIVVSSENRVATITINREARRNSLDHVAMRLLFEALNDCVDSDASVIVLHGAGTRAFCAGDDIKASAERSAEQNRLHHARGLRVLELIEEHPCLVVAAIEGFCLGGGLELAISCDCRIAAQRASFGLPEVRKLSLLPSWGGLTRLPKLVGVAHTKSIALLGQRLSAEEARRIGLVNEVVPDGRALDRARAFASEYAAEVSRTTVALAKQAIVHGYGAPRDTARLIDELSDRVQTNAAMGAGGGTS